MQHRPSGRSTFHQPREGKNITKHEIKICVGQIIFIKMLPHEMHHHAMVHRLPAAQDATTAIRQSESERRLSKVCAHETALFPVEREGIRSMVEGVGKIPVLTWHPSRCAGLEGRFTSVRLLRTPETAATERKRAQSRAVMGLNGQFHKNYCTYNYNYLSVFSPLFLFPLVCISASPGAPYFLWAETFSDCRLPF